MADGALEGRLPNLHLPSGDLIPAHNIAAFEDGALGEEPENEGYRGPQEKDSGHVSLEMIAAETHLAAQRGACSEGNPRDQEHLWEETEACLVARNRAESLVGEAGTQRGSEAFLGRQGAVEAPEA